MEVDGLLALDQSGLILKLKNGYVGLNKTSNLWLKHQDNEYISHRLLILYSYLYMMKNYDQYI